MPKILAIILSLIAVVGFAFLLLLPQYQKFKISKAQVLSKETELSLKEEYFSQLESVSQDLEKRQEEISKVESAFPSDFDIPFILEFLQSIASQAGMIFVNIDSFSEIKAKEEKNFKETQISFEVSGTYESLLDFLSRLERSAIIIELSSVSFATLEESDVFSFEIIIKIRSWH